MQHSSPENHTPKGDRIDAHAEALKFQEAMLNASALSIIISSVGGKITTFNRAAEKLLGYQAAEVVGNAPAMIFHTSDEMAERAEEIPTSPGKQMQPAPNPFVAQLNGANPALHQATFMRKGGSTFPGTLSVLPLHGADEAITGYAAIITDLTENKNLRDQIAVSEKKFHLLAENIPGAIYLCHNDHDYTMIYVNDEIQNITGHPAEDFLSGRRSFAELFHPEDRDAIYNTINRGISKKKSFHLRYRIRHASGEWRWIEENGVGVFEGDQLTMLEGFLQDITFQKEAEDKLQKIAEENLRFFNNPVNLNAVADFDGNLLRISPSWTKMLGWDEHELRSKPVLQFLHPDDVKNTGEELRNLAKSRKVQTLENRLVCKDGSYRWLLWGLAPDPKTKRIYASAVDISARKQSEDHILSSKANLEGITLQLQEQNRRLDEFAHIISHNLRAPVNNIHALINLLDGHSEIDDYKIIFDKLKNVAKNLSETMNALMDILKAKTQPDVDLTEVRFKEILDKVVQSLEGELIVAQAAVTFDFNEAPAIRYPKPYLESIFQNLLTNAIKYKSPRRKPLIHFRSYVRENHVELQVSDNGQGIDMDRFGDKIFGLHKTFHEHQEARGVGLFLIKTQIEALGGRITVASEVDKGTTFTIRFR